MARILYTGSVAELRGSIAGSTYQRNASGTIAKSKNNQRFSSSVDQSLAQQRFAQIATLWNGISGAFKAEWQSNASVFDRTDFYGRVKKLNGFQWFQLVNNNLLQVGASTQDEPYTDFDPIALPLFNIDIDSSTLDFRFSVNQDLTNYYVMCFASAPCSSVQQSSRIQKLFIKKFTGNPITTVSLLSEYESTFGVTWSSLLASSTFILQLSFFTISLINGVSSQYTFDVEYLTP